MILEAKPIAWKSASSLRININTNFFSIKGHEYERLLYEYLSQQGEYTIRQQWFQYKTDQEDKLHRCQIDIMIFNRKAEQISVIESKLVYGQTTGIHMRMQDICVPVVKKAFSFEAVGGVIVSIENCKNHILYPNIEEATKWSIQHNRIAFMQWKPTQANWALKLQESFYEVKHKLRVTQ